MPPLLAPSEPHFPDDGGAERTVWEALRDQLPDDALLLHGVRLQDGPHEYEIDLLVAWPGEGVAAIEVKGGHVARDREGWWQTGRDGDRRRIDPVGQARGARHTLVAMLQERGLPVAGARSTHLVALPFRTVPPRWDAFDLPRSQLVDETDLARSFGVTEQILKALRNHGSGQRTPTGQDVVDLFDALNPQLEGGHDAVTASAAHEVRQDQLTQDQVKILDVLRHQTRLRVVGGAGSGKTVLALAQARRRAKEGDRVALLCYSRGLGRYLQRVTSTWPAHERPAWVGLFHDLPQHWDAPPPPSDAPPEYWEHDLPLALGDLAAQQPAAKRFTSVVVDEAQDFGELWWPSLLRCLRDPDTGGLAVFMDDDQRVFPRHGKAPIELQPFPLHENLRSTKPIAQTFGALTTAQVHPRGGDGLPVRLVETTREAAVPTADDAVDALLDEGWDPGRIALLTTGKRHPEQVSRVTHDGYEHYWDAFFDADDVFYGHVLGFKGLERSVVVLCVNGFQSPERARELLYTGMSRARSLLVVVGSRAELEQVGGESMRRRLQRARPWEVAGAE